MFRKMVFALVALALTLGIFTTINSISGAKLATQRTNSAITLVTPGLVHPDVGWNM